MKLRDTILCWTFTAGLSLGVMALEGWYPAEQEIAWFATGVGAAATWAGITIAVGLTRWRILLTSPSLIAPLLFGPVGSIILWTAGGLFLLARLRGEEGIVKPGFVTRRMLMRRVMDSNFPDEKSHLALIHGFAGPYEELRPAVAPVATMPPVLAIPILSRLSLATDSVTRLTARKRLELLLAALKEEADRPVNDRGPRHAALRIRKAEIHLLLASLTSTDADERTRRLVEAAALSFVASDDFPGNDAYTAYAAAAAARVGSSKAAIKLHARIRDPRRAWSVGRTLRLCARMKPAVEAAFTRPAQIRVKGEQP